MTSHNNEMISIAAERRIFKWLLSAQWRRVSKVSMHAEIQILLNKNMS